MADDAQTAKPTTALQVACDTEVSGCVFLMRTEADDRDRLVEITRQHVADQHGKEYSAAEIEERHVREVEL
ncbi:hypothetical protein ACFQGT_20050 [Natrialbaceae archaeon GCM10025810]|uniref:hypothetical protein n=1 Tax=Halovalidus salilacus TaxID=3075124 RepID=UPI0036066A3F